MRIEEIDKNLKVESSAELADGTFLDVRNEPFDVYGLYDYKNQPRFCRMPIEVAKKAHEFSGSGIEELVWHTPGGRVRFTTDSPYVAIRCKMQAVTFMPHMPLCGMCGFDLYETVNGKDYYRGTYMPPFVAKEGEYATYTLCGNGEFSSMVWVGETGKMRSFTIHMPLYNDVEKLEVGLRNDASVDHGAPYRPYAPVVFYGNSITQGAAASKPGNSYENIFSACYGIDHINLGFSGSGCGEPCVAEFVAGLDMSVLVMDYDYNASCVEWLEMTHKPFYDTVRKAHPDLPIIFVTSSHGKASHRPRREAIYRSYQAARAEGDKHVYFVDGYTMHQGRHNDATTVDGGHPNDLGFLLTAEYLGDMIEQILAGEL